MASTIAPRPDVDAPARSTGRPRAFSGRVVFDHLPQTAGSALNRWLRTSLGEGCASPDIPSIDHRSLIARFGGAYSVLTAQVTFDRPGLDPRYQYVTLLREPIDRLVSWLHAVVGNHTAADLPAGWHDVKRFLESHGTECSPKLEWNTCVRHFAAIEGVQSGDGRHLLEAAVSAVERYDVWGLYESMPQFLADFAGLLGTPVPGTLDRVNVTRLRPAVADLPATLRSRLVGLNALDLEFYAHLKRRYSRLRRGTSRSVVVESAWEPLPAPKPLACAGPEFTLLSARVVGAEIRAAPGLIEFDFAFSLARPIADPEITLTVHDAPGSRVFAASTTDLGQPIGPVAAGSHRVRFTFMANLPEGEYAVGLRFGERLSGCNRVLGAFDGLAPFRLGGVRPATGTAVFQLPATIHCVQVDAAAAGEGWRLQAADANLHSQVGRIEGTSAVSDGRAGYLLFGPYKTVLAGGWKAVVEGAFQPGAGRVRIDVVSGAGRDVHAEVDVTAPAGRAELEFHVDRPVQDLEIRVWVDELAVSRIDVIAVERPAGGGSGMGTCGFACYGSTDLRPGGDDDDGLPEGRIAPVREAAAAAVAAEAEVANAGGDPHGSVGRAARATAGGAAAVGDPARGVEAARLGERVGDPAVAAPAAPRTGRSGASRADDARDARTSACRPRIPAEGGLSRRPEPTFSIVVATDGRAAALGELLDSLPFLAGPAFEVCVVRGPTEDGVGDVLDAWRGRIKTASNPSRNLSISRNIGIAMAAGEIVAFLDDDAIPEPGWLADLAAAFHDPAVACAGGVNRDRSGTGVQYGYATANRMGQARWDRAEPADSLCVPGAADFPYTQGTNTAIRRADLEALGGFDEEYDFYLDETDLCCRLVDAGRAIRQLPRAFVHHRSLPSAIRSPDGVTHSLRAVLKNKLYFSLVNARGHHGVEEACADFEAFVAIQEQHLRRMAARSPDGARWLERFPSDVARAHATGLARGRSGLRRLMCPGLVGRHRTPFLPFIRRPAADQRDCPLHVRTTVPHPSATARASAGDGLRGQRDLLRSTWAGLVPPGSRVALALEPRGLTVADAAIWQGMRSLLESLGVTVGHACDPESYDPDRLARAVPRGPILLLGGHFGDGHGAEPGLRLRMLADFPDRQIFHLPRSVRFGADEARDAMAAMLATRRNTTLVVRDSQCLAFARTHFPVPSLSCPDAAVAIHPAREGRDPVVPIVALWGRRVEQDLALPQLPPGSIVSDWDDEAPAGPSCHDGRFGAWAARATMADAARARVAQAAARFLPRLRDSPMRERVDRCCSLLGNGHVVITNRLHAHLLCTLLHVPHVVCDGIDGEISAYRDSWHDADPLAHFAASPHAAVALARELAAGPCRRVAHAA